MLLLVGLVAHGLVKVYLLGCGSCGCGAAAGRAGHSLLQVPAAA